MDEDFQKALQYAFLLLRYRDRSKKELISRLGRKGFSMETGEKVIGYLAGKGFLDDAKLAESLKRTAVEQKFMGKRGIIQYLISKGISTEIIEGISGNDEDYLDAAMKLVEKKQKQLKGLDPMVIKRRLWGALARKGYSPEVIKTALSNYIRNDDLYN